MDRLSRSFLDQDHDLVVIGGGPAARGAARAARWSGARVALVTDHDADRSMAPGAFFAAAARGTDPVRALADAQHADTRATFPGSLDALRLEGVNVVTGRARFVDPGEIDVDGMRFRSGRFVIATGSRPAVPTIAGAADAGVLTSDDLWSLDPLPRSIVVVGGGSSGCELAQSFARLGARVTIFESRDRLLPNEEAAASAIVTRALRNDGVEVRSGTTVRSLETRRAGALRAFADRGESVDGDKVMLAVGRAPFTEGLGLDVAGVEIDAAGFVRVDSHLRTTARGTYAAGDITGLLPYPHAAAEMGRLAAGHALKRGPRGPFRAKWIPRVTFTDPQIATLGVFEADAPRFARVAELPFTEVDRAIAEGRTEGYCKLVAGPRLSAGRLFGGRLIGATVVAPHAGELIAEITLAMRAGMFPARLAQAVHGYPTWSSAVQQCAAQFVVEIDGRRARRPRRS